MLKQAEATAAKRRLARRGAGPAARPEPKLAMGTDLLRHFAGTRQKGGVPTQSWIASHIQWNEGKCDGFVRSIESTLPDLEGIAPTAGLSCFKRRGRGTVERAAPQTHRQRRNRQ